MAQLRKRSGRDVEECLNEILGMRPQVERRYVFIGAVDSENVEALDLLSQAQRDAILSAGINDIGLQGATGRLGPKLFTLVGDEKFNASMQIVGKENIEARLRTYVAEAVNDG